MNEHLLKIIIDCVAHKLLFENDLLNKTKVLSSYRFNCW